MCDYMPRQDQSPCVFDDDLITTDLIGDVFFACLGFRDSCAG